MNTDIQRALEAQQQFFDLELQSSWAKHCVANGWGGAEMIAPILYQQRHAEAVEKYGSEEAYKAHCVAVFTAKFPSLKK